MRIISGFYKNKKIELPQNSQIRPTMSKVREALFNILLHSRYVTKDIKEMSFLDLFCGSGVISIEAASRGFKKITAIDIETDAIRENIKTLNLEEKIEVLDRDLARIKNSEEQFDIVFADPPYNDDESINNTIKNLIEYNWTHTETLLALESKVKKAREPELNFDGCKLLDSRNYGGSRLSVFSFI